MTRLAIQAGALALGAALAAPASALTITGGAFDGTDVGGLDTFLQVSDSLPNSSEAAEEAWVEEQLGTDVTLAGRTDPSPLYDIAENEDYFAVQLFSEPGYYVIKNATFWALFRNEASLGWGAFDSSLLPAGMNIGDVTVSHVTEFNGETGFLVPVPGSAMLLGAGLLAAAGIARRTRRRSA